MGGETIHASDRRAPWLGIVVAVGLISAGGAFLWASLAGDPTGISPTALYTTRLQDLQGKQIALAKWQGRILLLNFWATWCAPCREEIPLLVDTQHRYAGDGVQIVGIGVDSMDKILPFVTEVAIDYPILVDQTGGIALSRRLGNRTEVLPFTALIDRQGRVVSVKAGAWTAEQLAGELKKLI